MRGSRISKPARRALCFEEAVLCLYSLRSVYLLFAVVAALATVIAAFLPGGPPRQVSDAGAPGELDSTALPV